MLCDCGHDSPSFSICLTSAGPRSRCRTCLYPPARSSVANPYADLTLDHVHDETGSPLRVTSLAQMREAERRYRFRSLVANVDSVRHDEPPQMVPKSLHEQMDEPFRDSDGNYHESHWLYPEIAREMAREMEAGNEL